MGPAAGCPIDDAPRAQIFKEIMGDFRPYVRQGNVSRLICFAWNNVGPIVASGLWCRLVVVVQRDDYCGTERRLQRIEDQQLQAAGNDGRRCRADIAGNQEDPSGSPILRHRTGARNGGHRRVDDPITLFTGTDH